MGDQDKPVGAFPRRAAVPGEQGAQLDAGVGVERAAYGVDGGVEAGLVGELALHQQVLLGLPLLPLPRWVQRPQPSARAVEVETQLRVGRQDGTQRLAHRLRVQGGGRFDGDRLVPEAAGGEGCTLGGREGMVGSGPLGEEVGETTHHEGGGGVLARGEPERVVVGAVPQQPVLPTGPCGVAVGEFAQDACQGGRVERPAQLQVPWGVVRDRSGVHDHGHHRVRGARNGHARPGA